MIKDLKLHLNHNKSTDTYSILSIEKLDEEIKSSIKYYSEFFPQGINPELLSFMDKNTYYYYEKLKSINLDFEVYVCIKYDLDIKEIIEYRNALFKVD